MKDIHQAATYAHEAMVKELLNKGADIESQDINGWTTLYLAVKDDPEAIVIKLLTNGADANAKPPLYHCAAGNGYEGIAIEVLDKGSDANIETTYHELPLHAALCVGNHDIFDTLLQTTDNKNKPPREFVKSFFTGKIVL
jgi:ankyrin repeat protein